MQNTVKLNVQALRGCKYFGFWSSENVLKYAQKYRLSTMKRSDVFVQGSVMKAPNFLDVLKIDKLFF
jgi:hypothetical protein